MSTAVEKEQCQTAGLVLYKAKPTSRQEEIILIAHILLITDGFHCTGAHEDEPESDKKLIVPSNWNSTKSDGVYGFRYKSPDKKYVLQLKAVTIGGLKTDFR